MKMKFGFCVAAVALLALSSCGPLNKGGIGQEVLTLAKSRFGGATAPQPAADAALSQEDVAAAPGKYIRINFRNSGQWSTMVEAASNANRETWVSSSNISVTFENGIVVATRGLPRDLMAANVTETRAAIRAGGGNSQRQHDFLTNLDRISGELLQCSIVSKGPEVIERLQKAQSSVRFEEHCRGDNLEFTNVYWVSSAGAIIRSLQAVSPDAGYLQIDVF